LPGAELYTPQKEGIMVKTKRTSAFQISIAVNLLAIGLAVNSPPARAQGSGVWTNTGSLNVGRVFHTFTLLANGQVLVAGGDGASGLLTSAELYNPATGTFTLTGSMAVAREEHTATLLPNGEVLVAGGYQGGDYTAEAELYNPSTGQWKTTGSMTVARALAGAALLQNGEVLVAGGENLDGTAGSSAELYNPSTGVWKVTGSMHSNHAAPATLLPNGEVLVVSEATDIYNPSTGEWTVGAPPLFAAGGPARLSNGDVLFFGGRSTTSAAQVYNPSTHAWSNLAGQTGIYVSGPLVALASGKALLAGGATSYHTAAEIAFVYDPSTNAWSETGSLLQAGLEAGVLLSNGQVLVAGTATSRRNSNGTLSLTFFGNAELYTP
jgi:N-acetylneuraminic acid mutarotase